MPRLRLDESSETIRIQIVAPEAWAARVDQYARKHKMNRSEAIRALADKAMVSAADLEPLIRDLEDEGRSSAVRTPLKTSRSMADLCAAHERQNQIGQSSFGDAVSRGF